MMQILTRFFVATILALSPGSVFADRIPCDQLENPSVSCLDFPDYYYGARTQPAKPLPQNSYANRIADRTEFDRLQRTYIINKNRRPHILFVIDRAKKAIYYANSSQFSYHESFAEALGLDDESSRVFFRRNYIDEDRPLLIGTVGYLPESGGYYWEVSDKNILTAELYTETYQYLKPTFFTELKFRPNSIQQESIRQTVTDVPAFTLADVSTSERQEIYYAAKTTGIFRAIASEDTQPTWEANNIVLFGEAPVSVLPLQGIITLQPSSPLAHIHMLARNWQVPDVYWTDIDYEQYRGHWVTLDTTNDKVSLRLAEPDEIEAVQKKLAESALAADTKLPTPDLTYQELDALSEQDKADSVRFGFKAANLGHVTQVAGVDVPPGYSIPFYFYDEFMRENQLDELVAELLAEDQSTTNDQSTQLAELRQRIENGVVNAAFKQKLLKHHRDFFGDAAVFVRSSTNAEDSPGFTGAGLYTSVPNVISDDDVLLAVKKVWASVWNDRAYQARDIHGIDHATVYASVLVQQAMAADSAGVLVTKNPFNEFQQNSVFINAKKGLGIKVVEGNRVPEQIIVDRITIEIVRLTRSQENTQLVLDGNGGVKEVPIEASEGLVVLSPELIEKLVQIAVKIEAKFEGVPQDIEWLVMDGQVWIVQSRPFI